MEIEKKLWYINKCPDCTPALLEKMPDKVKQMSDDYLYVCLSCGFSFTTEDYQ
jgi:uncharacterized Zn finger protein